MLMSSARAGRAGLSLSATPFRPAVLCSSIAAAGDRIRRNSRRGLDGRPNAGGRPRTTTVAGQEKIHGTSKNSCMGEIHQSVWASERSEGGRGGGAERRTSNSASCESERGAEQQSAPLGRERQDRQTDRERERGGETKFPLSRANPRISIYETLFHTCEMSVRTHKKAAARGTAAPGPIPAPHRALWNRAEL